jgi:hypothetical protein
MSEEAQLTAKQELSEAKIVKYYIPGIYPKVRRNAAPHIIFRYELVKMIGHGTFG